MEPISLEAGPLSPDEAEWVFLFRDLSEEEQAALIEIVRSIARKSPPPMIHVPPGVTAVLRSLGEAR